MLSRALLTAALVLAQACASQAPMTATEELLSLATDVVQAASADARLNLVEQERRRVESDPSHDNLLRLSVVRALSGALPADLNQTRDQLQALTTGHDELTDSQRRFALLVLIMVDERLRLGSQIVELQRQIDSLTDIEASLGEKRGDERNGAPPERAR